MQNDWTYSTTTGSYGNDGAYLVRNKNFKISWNDRGIGLHLRVDDNDEIMGKSGTVTNGDVSISTSSKLFSDVNYINIIHTVTNNDNKPHIVDFRCWSDIDIQASDGSTSDFCPVQNIEGNRGAEFTNKDRTVRFLLRDFPFVTNVDTYSYTGCPGCDGWTSCSDYIYSSSSGSIYFSWQNQEIKPHESKNYSYSIGIGEYNPKVEQNQETIECNIPDFNFYYNFFISYIIFIIKS